MGAAAPHVPQVFDLCSDYVVQEYALWGSLKAALQNKDVAQRLTLAHKRSICAQLSRAGTFLESGSIVHADLSCRNLLLCWLEDDARYTIVKVTDFGLAVVLPPHADSMVNKQPQATRWCAPETVAYL